MYMCVNCRIVNKDMDAYVHKCISSGMHAVFLFIDMHAVYIYIYPFMCMYKTHLNLNVFACKHVYLHVNICTVPACKNM